MGLSGTPSINACGSALFDGTLMFTHRKLRVRLTVGSLGR